MSEAFWHDVPIALEESDRTQALCARVGPMAPLYLIRLWRNGKCSIPQNRTTGEQRVAALEALVRWRGRRGKLVDALIAEGFLEDDGDALVVIPWQAVIRRQWLGALAPGAPELTEPEADDAVAVEKEKERQRKWAQRHPGEPCPPRASRRVPANVPVVPPVVPANVPVVPPVVPANVPSDGGVGGEIKTEIETEIETENTHSDASVRVVHLLKPSAEKSAPHHEMRGGGYFPIGTLAIWDCFRETIALGKNLPDKPDMADALLIDRILKEKPAEWVTKGLRGLSRSKWVMERGPDATQRRTLKALLKIDRLKAGVEAADEPESRPRQVGAGDVNETLIFLTGGSRKGGTVNVNEAFDGLDPEQSHSSPGNNSDADEYRALYRTVWNQPGADWVRGSDDPYTLARSRKGITAPLLLASLQALRQDKWGSTLSLDATLSQSAVQKGINLSRGPPADIYPNSRLNSDMAMFPEG